MNINLPDIIWTIILFMLFVLVLNGLLIKPVLRHMDERKDKVARAHIRAMEREQSLEESRARALEARAASQRAAEDEARRIIAAAEENAKQELKDYAEELAARENAAFAEVGKAGKLADERLASLMDRMTEAFTEKLTKGGEG
ncbi:MAG: hypothetical protein J5854_08180 [Clostridia bacterium]|nr:hypothetical protein [Clostridia bacterium]